jgi:hypothetical protein
VKDKPTYAKKHTTSDLMLFFRGQSDVAFTYDSAGNRLTQESMVHVLSSMVNYNYNLANF